MFLGINTVTAQGEIYDELYDSFGEIPAAMSSSEIQEYAAKTEALPKKLEVLLDDLMLEPNVLVPVGKRVNGKYIILLYLEYDATEGNPYYEFRSATFNKKTGEIYMSASHILDVGLGGDTYYDGSYTIDGDYFIMEQLQTVNNETTSSKQRYKFEKYMAFDEHLD